jgi:hypothetical protein
LGTNSFYSRIGGGFDNSIAGGLFAATIAGGRENVIDVASSYSAIGGGLTNYIGANARATVIAGGEFNATSRNSYYDVISGGNSNLIGYNSWNATIAGGHRNIIEGDSYFSSIGGGYFNTIASNSFYATLGGGFANRVGVNSDYGTISGGYANVILTNSSFATIPGGELNAATNYAFAAGRQAKANHTGSFVWADSFNGVLTSSANNQFTVRASGGVRIFSNTATNAGVSLAPGGTSWGVISDRNVKKDFEPADGQDILKKLATMPITHWHYQWEESNATPHLGPMAQDFKAAFYPGRDDKSITTQEIDGVALAAIQGLNQKVEQTTRDKDAEIHALKERLATLEALVRQMSKAAQK